jgi:hypothetical protein
MFEISCQKGRTAWHRASHVTRRHECRRCRKNYVFGNQNIFKDRKNSSTGCYPCFADCSALQFLAVNQIIFLSIWMSKSGLYR